MTLPAIASLVPQQGTMALLDRLLAADAQTLCAEVAIRADTLFCDGAGVGAWIGIEYMAQAVAAHAGYAARLRGDAVKAGFLLGTRRFESSVPAFAVGLVLRVHAQCTLQGANGLAAFECRIDDAATGEQLATATITVFAPDNVDEFLQQDRV